ncbi:Plastidic glucose transporter 4 [Fusarium oxysporum f. sp. albedinis]|nr:Plastidic glucose transporter 4 [Fusarium oxysporum f. sp. albedinis]
MQRLWNEVVDASAVKGRLSSINFVAYVSEMSQANRTRMFLRGIQDDWTRSYQSPSKRCREPDLTLLNSV